MTSSEADGYFTFFAVAPCLNSDMTHKSQGWTAEIE